MNRLLMAAVLGAFVLAACGEREQVAEGKRTYQGKADAHSWDNAPQERASLEARLKLRQLAQDEQRRISR